MLRYMACVIGIAISTFPAMVSGSVLPISTLDDKKKFCSEETERRLVVGPGNVYLRPNAKSRPIAALRDKGTIVYIGKSSGDWLKVMYVDVEDSVDCCLRPIKRKCPIGWIPKTVKLGSLFG